MKWGILGERDYDVCVIGFHDSTIREKLSPYLTFWQPLNETILSWIGYNFLEQGIPKEIIESLYLNYSNDDNVLNFD